MNLRAPDPSIAASLERAWPLIDAKLAERARPVEGQPLPPEWINPSPEDYNPGERQYRLTPEDLAKRNASIRHLFANGVWAENIGERFGLSKKQVYAILEGNGK